MPPERFLKTAFGVAELLKVKVTGPAIFVQSHSLIVPSGSLEAEPSSEILSVGKVITWSGPAMVIGRLLFSLQSSHDLSSFQETQIPPAMMDGIK